MKKHYYGYLCALLLSVPQFSQARPEEILYGIVGGGFLCSAITYALCTRNSEAEKYQHKRYKLEQQEKTANIETKKFHLIQDLQRLQETFSPIKEAQPNLEQQTNEQRQLFLKKIIEQEGSVTTFEEKLKDYINQYKTLDPQSAEKHNELFLNIKKLQSNLHTDHYVIEQKKKERELAMAKAVEDAQLKKIQNEATLSDQSVRILNKTEEEVQKFTTMNVQLDSKLTRALGQFSSMKDTLKDTLESIVNRRFNELADSQKRRTLEHKEELRRISELENKLTNMEDKLTNIESDGGNRLQIIGEDLRTVLALLMPPKQTPPAPVLYPDPNISGYAQQVYSQSGQKYPTHYPAPDPSSGNWNPAPDPIYAASQQQRFNQSAPPR